MSLILKSNWRLLFVLWCLLSVLPAYAQMMPLTNALSFAPPPSDNSVMFLSQIFGIVDGVISGTGSQIFGKMMGVFNAAVLALGSIALMYTLLIGTLNTAHEGEFLGKKWSSIWLPVRCTIGMSLLIPKATGYCIMQIFIMWIVLQGIGAADKIWNAALNYLNAGGKLSQTQLSSAQLTGAKFSKVDPSFVGASTILTGQVCMYGLQKSLENMREKYLNLASNDMGPCYQANAAWKKFCDNAVPDFMSTINPVGYQQDSDDTSFDLPMPNFDVSNGDLSLYHRLNGLCGKIHWNHFDNTGITDVQFDRLNFSPEQKTAYQNSRAIALTEMYSALNPVAIAMVENDPNLSRQPRLDNPASTVANYQFGLPTTEKGTVCDSYAPDKTCYFWQKAPDNSELNVLFSGQELINAIATYDGLMMSILNLSSELADEEKAYQLRRFITQSKADGWMFAGAYFFNLVNLSGSPQVQEKFKDEHSGLEQSQMYDLPSCQPGTEYLPGDFCWFFSQEPALIHAGQNIRHLIQGAGNDNAALACQENLSFAPPGLYQPSDGYIQPKGRFSTAACASTVLGFIGNSYYVNIPGQADMKAMTLPDIPLLFTAPKPNVKQPASDSCRHLGNIASLSTCFSSGVSHVLSNLINFMTDTVFSLLSTVFSILLVVPIKLTIWPQMQHAMYILSHVSMNPIVDLANMGAEFIQNTVYAYIGMVAVSGFAILPMMGNVILVMVAFFMPLYTAWLSFFLSIGFTACYYIPMLPYIIFTFGVIAWFFAVIEAIVAAPIFALGVTTPEGEGLLGKGEHGLMLIINVFLRPSMMIIGFISSIGLSYVSIWVMNKGFDIAGGFLKINGSEGHRNASADIYGLHWGDFPFAQLIGCMFYIVMYVSLYTTIIQKAFTLIFILPDKILRWIGGHPESYGGETQQWLQEGGQKLDQFGQMTGHGFTSGVGEQAHAIKNRVGPFSSSASDPRHFRTVQPPRR